MATSPFSIFIKDLVTEYTVEKRSLKAVEGVDLQIKEGEVMGLAGESACGKSTLAYSILRLLPANGHVTQGEIQLNGKNLINLTDEEFRRVRWTELSIIFQGAMNALNPCMTITDQISEAIRAHEEIGKEEANGRSINLLSEVGISERFSQSFPHELSGGMKQRVIIAMALLLKPKFVIADEPTTALDVLIQAQIVNLLKNLKKDGMSFMLITHDLAVLSEIADKIGIMYGGHMVEFGSSEDIYKNPKHPYTQGLLESIPTLKGNPPKYIPGIPPSLLDVPTQCRFIDRCPLVVEKCTTLPPKFKTQTGYVRCWLYEDKE